MNTNIPVMGLVNRRWAESATSLIVAVMWAPWHAPLFLFMESFEAYTIADIVGWVVGLTAGSFLLTWLYRGSGGSVLLVAVWHTACNFTSAPPVYSGTPAAIASTVVMVAAVAIVIADLRSRRARRRFPAEVR